MLVVSVVAAKSMIVKKYIILAIENPGTGTELTSSPYANTVIRIYATLLLTG
jgi:hypothetical protein